MIKPPLLGMFSMPLCSSLQNTLLPRPMIGRIRLIDHSGNAVSTRLESAPAFLPDIVSGLLTWLGRVTEIGRNVVVQETTSGSHHKSQARPYSGHSRSMNST